jgi:hypothetical protein
MARQTGSTRRSEETRKRDIRINQKRKKWLKEQIARLQRDGGGSRSTGTRKTQLARFRKELQGLGGAGGANLPKSTRSGGSHTKGMSNLGSNYKKEEKKATKEATTWRKSKEYKEGVKKHNESLKVKNKKQVNKNTNSSSSSSSSSSGKKKSEMGKEAWLKATRNSPAAKAGISPEKRWEAQQRHREWKKKKKK